MRSQPWAPLIDGLVEDAVLQLSPGGDKALKRVKIDTSNLVGSFAIAYHSLSVTKRP